MVKNGQTGEEEHRIGYPLDISKRVYHINDTDVR